MRTTNPAEGSELANFALRLGLGILMGLAGGLLLALLLRFHRLVPESMQNVMVLSAVLALFQVSDWLLHESGILSVTVAGMVVGNLRSQSLRELQEFKEHEAKLRELFTASLASQPETAAASAQHASEGT